MDLSPLDTNARGERRRTTISAPSEVSEQVSDGISDWQLLLEVTCFGGERAQSHWILEPSDVGSIQAVRCMESDKDRKAIRRHGAVFRVLLKALLKRKTYQDLGPQFPPGNEHKEILQNQCQVEKEMSWASSYELTSVW